LRGAELTHFASATYSPAQLKQSPVLATITTLKQIFCKAGRKTPTATSNSLYYEITDEM
jgi:hypothetical protein